jgi:hypothetical protein
MAIGQKLAGAMSKGPSKGAMTRVSPGVYRDAEGKLVGSKGQKLPQASRQAQRNDATNLALNGVSQYGNMPQMNEPMQTQPLTLQPGQNPSREQLMQMFNAMPQQSQPNPIAQVQTPGGQGYRYGNPSGTPWQDVSNGVAKGSLRNMAQQARLQQQQSVAQAMQAAQNQQPQATPGRRR